MMHRAKYQGLALCGLLSGLALSATVVAQTYPTRPIRIIDTFAPGGTTDLMARAFIPKLSERLGQAVFLEARPGGGGIVGTQLAAQSDPDGHTLLFGYDGVLVLTPHIQQNLQYDTLRDFYPVSKVGSLPYILAGSPTAPFKTLREFLDFAKAKSGPQYYGTAGAGSTPHLAGQLLKNITGIDMAHVAYKGGGPALNDLMGGQIPLAIVAVAAARQHIDSGRIRGLAVMSASRSTTLPNVPTFAEAGIANMEVETWVGILAPAKTAAAIVERLNRELREVMNDPEVRARFATLGAIPNTNTSDQFREQIRADLQRWGVLIKQANVKLE